MGGRPTKVGAEFLYYYFFFFTTLMIVCLFLSHCYLHIGTFHNQIQLCRLLFVLFKKQMNFALDLTIQNPLSNCMFPNVHTFESRNSRSPQPGTIGITATTTSMMIYNSTIIIRSVPKNNREKHNYIFSPKKKKKLG